MRIILFLIFLLFVFCFLVFLAQRYILLDIIFYLVGGVSWLANVIKKKKQPAAVVNK